MKPSFKKIIIEIYYNLLHTVLRSRNTRKRLTASIIVRKKIHGGCRDRYIKRQSHFAGQYAQVFRHFRQSRLSASHRERDGAGRSE